MEVSRNVESMLIFCHAKATAHIKQMENAILYNQKVSLSVINSTTNR